MVGNVWWMLTLIGLLWLDKEPTLMVVRTSQIWCQGCIWTSADMMKNSCALSIHSEDSHIDHLAHCSTCVAGLIIRNALKWDWKGEITFSCSS